MMRVVSITGNEATGGASRAALRLIDPLNRHPEVSGLHLCGRVDRPNSAACSFAEPGRLRAVMTSLLGAKHSVPKAMHHRACRKNLLRITTSFAPSVIHVHNINPWYGLGLQRDVLVECARIAPVVCSLHDTWFLNGKRCYEGDPDVPDADHSPEVTSHRLLDLGNRLTFVSPSRWLAGEARKTFPNLRVETIPYGLDLNAFAPMDPAVARAALDLPPDVPLILVVGDHLDVPRKGMKELLEACAMVSQPFRLVVVASGRNPETDRLGERAIVVGGVNDDRLLRLLYASATVVAIPSLQDNFPCVMQEAFACGTPVAAFATGGIPDAVLPGQTGWLAPTGDVPALAAALDDALSVPHDEREAMRLRCREHAERFFHESQQVDAVIRLYREVVL